MAKGMRHSLDINTAWYTYFDILCDYAQEDIKVDVKLA